MLYLSLPEDLRINNTISDLVLLPDASNVVRKALM